AVRRPHPLQADGTIIDGIRRERERLAAVRESADVIVDTSANNIHQLATRISDLFADEGTARHTLTILSFGFKYGLPPDADLVADMRFLPNPFWNEELRALTGEDERVREYVLAQEGAVDFVDAYADALRPVLAGYQRENKRHSVVAVGCTGGKHRSVVMARELARRLEGEPGVAVRVKDRDLGRE
ncbi:MAG TPA: RNase adapter RapZ, partial [Agromyces sp.]